MSEPKLRQATDEKIPVHAHIPRWSDMPINQKLIDELIAKSMTAQKCIIADCLLIPSGSEIVGIVNADRMTAYGMHLVRVYYRVKSEPQDYMSVGHIFFDEEQCEKYYRILMRAK